MDLFIKKNHKTWIFSILNGQKIRFDDVNLFLYIKSSRYVNHQNQKTFNVLILILEVKNIIRYLIYVRSLEEKQYQC